MQDDDGALGERQRGKGVADRRLGLHLRPAISPYLWCCISMPQPRTEYAVTAGARPEGLSRHPADTAGKKRAGNTATIHLARCLTQ